MGCLQLRTSPLSVSILARSPAKENLSQEVKQKSVDKKEQNFVYVKGKTLNEVL